MIFEGTDIECAEVIAELDAALGYPRGYTQEDVDSGLVVLSGPGPWPPMEELLALLRTETVAVPVPVEIARDERGEPVRDREGKVQPVGEERRCKLPAHLLDDGCREIVAKGEVLRLLNRGTRDELLASAGIGAARASAIIARRAQGRITRVEDARLPAVALRTALAARVARFPKRLEKKP